jgi:hypothetical protein
MLGIPWVAAWLAASEEGLSSMQLVQVISEATESTWSAVCRTVCIPQVLRPAVATRVFLVWPQPSSGSQVLRCYCLLPMQPSTLIKKIKIPRPLSQATVSNHCNIYTFILVLTEGQAGKAWEPSNNKYSSPPPTKKCLSLLPWLFTFTYSSTILS